MQNKSIYNDNVFKLLGLNLVLVIIGYASVNVGGETVFNILKNIRLAVLIFSIVFVLNSNGFRIKRLKNNRKIFVFLIFVALLTLLSPLPGESFFKALTFIFPFTYIIFSINYLLKYGALKLLISFSVMILIAYILVPISFLLFGGDLSGSNVYGEMEGQAFVSNQFGWGSALVILSAFTVLKYIRLKKIYKVLVFLAVLLSIYILIVSANRSGMLSVGLGVVALLLKDRSLVFYKKIMVVLPLILITLYVANKENSAIDFLMEKNEMQLETGQEGRYIAAVTMIEKFNEEPIRWFTGVGMFNYEFLKKSNSILKGYHNSYFEILFGAGIILFSLFLYFMLLYPFKVFWQRTVHYSLLFFPLTIIPFFESDLTAGQFLFFPWFSYILILNAKELSFATPLALRSSGN